MKSTKQFQLMNCRNYIDATQAWGDSYFTFSTPQQAMEFANSKWFKEEFNVVSEYEWEEQNGGERFQTQYIAQFPHSTKRQEKYLVVCIINHNPQLEDGEK